MRGTSIVCPESSRTSEGGVEERLADLIRRPVGVEGRLGLDLIEVTEALPHLGEAILPEQCLYRLQPLRRLHLVLPRAGDALVEVGHRVHLEIVDGLERRHHRFSDRLVLAVLREPSVGPHPTERDLQRLQGGPDLRGPLP
jgi:hypothetical protein